MIRAAEGVRPYRRSELYAAVHVAAADQSLPRHPGEPHHLFGLAVPDDVPVGKALRIIAGGCGQPPLLWSYLKGVSNGSCIFGDS